jgi:serpin B
VAAPGTDAAALRLLDSASANRDDGDSAKTLTVAANAPADASSITPATENQLLTDGDPTPALLRTFWNGLGGQDPAALPPVGAVSPAVTAPAPAAGPPPAAPAAPAPAPPVFTPVARGGGNGSSSQAAAAIDSTAIDVYARLAAASPANLAFSPYSLETALAMVYDGAGGQTAAQMAAALHLPGGGDQTAADFGALVQEINGGGQQRPYTLTAADALWAQAGYPLRPQFMQTLQNYYGAAPDYVDFIGNAEGARETINGWAAAQTHGLIDGVLPPGSVKPNTRLVLANAAYLSADWASQFQSTRSGTFTNGAGTAVTAQFMTQTIEFRKT